MPSSGTPSQARTSNSVRTKKSKTKKNLRIPNRAENSKAAPSIEKNHELVDVLEPTLLLRRFGAPLILTITSLLIREVLPLIGWHQRLHAEKDGWT